MNVGDKFPVTIAGQVVAEAVVKEHSEGLATLIIPATLVTMSYRTHDELTPEAPAEAPETSSHVLLTDEVVKPAEAAPTTTDGSPATPAQQVAPVVDPAASAPVAEQPKEVAPIPEAVEHAVEEKATE